MQIICSLNNKGTMRYNELRRKLDGISNTVLASSLKELEEEGLVERREYLEVPIRVEYSSTEMAGRLMPILEQLSDWGEEMMQREMTRDKEERETKKCDCFLGMLTASEP